MSGFVCPDCGARHDLFKSGGGETLARETGFRFLGRIPIDPRLVVASDDGKPFVLEYPTSPTSSAFDEIIAPILALSPPRMKSRNFRMVQSSFISWNHFLCRAKMAGLVFIVEN
jgi:hypothetical protein